MTTTHRNRFTVFGALAVTVTLSHLRAQPSTASQRADVQRYLQDASKGEAGIDPRLQTAARAGDPRAVAQVRRRMGLNSVQAKLNRELIDASEAQILRSAVDANYLREVAAIEQQERTEELRRQAREIERLKQDLQWQSQRKQNQTYK